MQVNICVCRESGRKIKIMYTLKMSYGDGYYYDEPEMAEVEILGTDEALDDACKVAKDEFDAIMERLDDIETRFYEVEASRYRYYVIYGFLELELGYVVNVHYYEVSVIEG